MITAIFGKSKFTTIRPHLTLTVHKYDMRASRTLRLVRRLLIKNVPHFRRFKIYCNLSVRDDIKDPIFARLAESDITIVKLLQPSCRRGARYHPVIKLSATADKIVSELDRLRPFQSSILDFRVNGIGFKKTAEMPVPPSFKYMDKRTKKRYEDTTEDPWLVPDDEEADEAAAVADAQPAKRTKEDVTEKELNLVMTRPKIRDGKYVYSSMHHDWAEIWNDEKRMLLCAAPLPVDPRLVGDPIERMAYSAKSRNLIKTYRQFTFTDVGVDDDDWEICIVEKDRTQHVWDRLWELCSLAEQKAYLRCGIIWFTWSLAELFNPTPARIATAAAATTTPRTTSRLRPLRQLGLLFQSCSGNRSKKAVEEETEGEGEELPLPTVKEVEDEDEDEDEEEDKDSEGRPLQTLQIRPPPLLHSRLLPLPPLPPGEGEDGPDEKGGAGGRG